VNPSLLEPATRVQREVSCNTAHLRRDAEDNLSYLYSER